MHGKKKLKMIIAHVINSFPKAILLNKLKHGIEIMKKKKKKKTVKENLQITIKKKIRDCFNILVGNCTNTSKTMSNYINNKKHLLVPYYE